MRVVTFKIEEELLEQLDKFCRCQGLSRSEVIRDAIMHYLRVRNRTPIAAARRIRVWI